MADIFISYKREDQENKGRILPIVRALQAEGFDVFYDVEIPPGSTWEQVLQTKINMAKSLIFLKISVLIKNVCMLPSRRYVDHHVLIARQQRVDTVRLKNTV